MTLRPDQVLGLDAVGAFINTGDAGIPEVLGGAGFLDIAHAAVYLHAQGGYFLGPVQSTTP